MRSSSEFPRGIVLRFAAVPVLAIVGMLALGIPDVPYDCDSISGLQGRADALQETAAERAEGRLVLATAVAAVFGLAGLLGASLRLRGGSRPGWPSALLSVFLLSQLVVFRLDPEQPLALPGIVLLVVGYLAVAIPVYSWVGPAIVLGLVAAFTSAERRADRLVLTVVVLVVTVYLPGAAFFAYDRFDPFCLD